jgi:hypothetical protein
MYIPGKQVHDWKIYFNFSSYGVYCDEKNNGEPCKDYKYRLCCKKKIKEDYGKFGKFSPCMGDCRAMKGHKIRTKECKKLSDGSYRNNCEKRGNKYVVIDQVPCTRTDSVCRGIFFFPIKNQS